MPKPDTPKTTTDVAAALRELAPEFVHLPLREAGAGECYEAWWVGEQHILRLARVDEEPGNGGDPSDALRAEMAVLSRLATAIDSQIPRPTHLAHDLKTGRAILLHEAVIGEPLLPERWAGLHADQRQRLAAAVGQFLAQLQAVLPGEVPVPLVHRDFCRASFPASAIDRLVFPRMPTDQVECCRRISSAFTPCPPAGRVLVHGDLYNHHILVAPDASLAGVIDFGDMGWGDPAWDLGTLMDDFGVGFVRAVLRECPEQQRAERLRRARYFCVWEALGWAAEELDEGREQDVDQNLARVGELAQLQLES